MKRILFALAALAVIASTQLAASGTALAHERRMVGPYQLVVGWLNEPAFAGNANAVDFRVTDTRQNPAKPVEGLEKTISVEVAHGGLAPVKLELRTRFNQPGAYAADIIPTRAGAYRFMFKGKIEDRELNETFESGPGRFDDVEEPTELQYPTKVPAAAALVERLEATDRELGTLRMVALAALAVAIVLPLGTLVLGRRP